LRYLRFIAELIVLLLLIVVYVENQDETFHFRFSVGLENWRFDREVPTIAAVYGAAIVGALVASFFAFIKGLRKRMLIRKYIKTIGKLEQELDTLRNLPLLEAEKDKV
jgi:putative membrane protein